MNYLVIGASSGIGEAITSKLVSENNHVFASYNTHQKANQNQIQFFHLDVMNDDLQTDVLPDQLDGVVYCPGSINLKPFHRIKAEDFLSDYQLQVIGAIKTIQAVLDRLKKSEHASIVLFSTVAVQMGFKFHTQVSSSKGAIEGLTRALSAELAPKIRVNCIAPSLTETPLADMLINNDEKKEANAKRHPMQRIGQTGDIADLALFLLSEKSSWITGQILHVDGGMSSIRG